MAHRALTLKYRPQVFADLIGQDHVSLVLGRALETGRVAHGYLFTGARGVGKTTSARILAKALNCETRRSGGTPGADPCNQCVSCREITNGISLDVAEIDGASNRGIADVQTLREKVRFAPTGGHHRVVIIDEVHQLSNDAFAALLKTLEEPPPHLVFIFATTDPQKVPETIRSRTQRFDFARVPVRKIADRLLEIARRESADPAGVKLDLTDGAAILIARKAEGSMRDAVSALDQVVSAGEPKVDEELAARVLGIPDHHLFFELGDAILGRDPRAALAALHKAFNQGKDPRELAEGLAEHVRHILVLKVDPQGGDLVPLAREDQDRVRQQGAAWSENDLLRLLKIVSDLSQPMKDSSQPMVHVEAAVLQMATLDPGASVGELIARLDALEQRIGGGSGPAGSAPPPAGRTPARTPAAAPTRSAAPPSTGRVRGGAAFTADAPKRGWGGGASAVNAAPPRSPSEAAAPPRSSSEAAAPSHPPRPQPGAAGPARPQPGAAAPSRSQPSPRPNSGGAPATAVALEGLARDTDSEACWAAVVAALNRKKRMLGAFLEDCRFVGVSASDLVIGMDDLHRAVVEEKENRALIAEEAAQAFARPLVLRCVPFEPGEVARPMTNDDARPMVDQAIAFFDGDPVGPRRPERTTE